MKLTRRDVLRFAGGSLLGTMFTPLPWKLLDDSSIWTQNWSLTPTLPRGAMTTRSTFCTLCPAGCAAGARCINAVPFAFDPAPGHPLGGMTLCPVGLAAHHMPYHPLRLDGPHQFSGKGADGQLHPIALQDVIAKVRAALASASASGGTVAVLDQRPGRALSALYQKFLTAYPSRAYITAPATIDETIASLAALSTGTMPDAGFDLEHTRTIVSFGAPLLDGWGQPGRMHALLGDRAARGVKLVQIESHRSRTAAGADLWLPVRPGTEAAVALSIANVIVRESLYAPAVERSIADFTAYRELVLRYHPHPVSALAGVSPDAIVQAARALANGPSIALSGGEAAAGSLPQAVRSIVAGLNLLCGNVGREGGIVYRADASSPVVPASRLQDVPDHSIRVLIMDGAESGEAFPAGLVERKLVPDNAVVVLLAPTLTARSSMADYLIPTASALQGWEELATVPGAVTASYAVVAPVLPVRGTVTDPVSFLSAVSGSFDAGVKDSQELLRRAAEGIYAARRGTIVSADGATRTAVAAMAGAPDVWEALVGGGCWIGDTPSGTPANVRFRLLPPGIEEGIAEATRPVTSESRNLVLEPFGMRGALSTGTISPIMSKIFQESNLRASGGSLLLNPATASALGVTDRDLVKVKTAQGSAQARVFVDPMVMPGVARAAVGPLPNKTAASEELGMTAVLDLCTLRADGTWRYTDATIEKVS